MKRATLRRRPFVLDGPVLGLVSGLVPALVPALVLGALGCGGDDAWSDATDSGADVIADAPGDATESRDGGAETSVDGGRDAGPDARPDAGTLPVLGCAWRSATPTRLEDLSAAVPAGFFNGELSIAEPAAGEVRIVTQPSGGPAFRMYGFDRTARAVTPLDGPSGANTTFQGAEHVALPSGAGASQVLVQTEAPSGALTITAYLVPDVMPRTGPLPAPITVSAGGYGVVAFPLTETTLFDAVTYTSSTSGPTVYHALGVGRATAATAGSLAVVTQSPNGDDLLHLDVAHVADQAYLFTSNGASLRGESMWIVPDSAVLTGQVLPRAFDVGTVGRMIDVAPSVAASTKNFAYYSAAPGAAGGALRVGQIGDAAMGTASAADLTVAYDDALGWLASPVLAAEWSGDDLLLLGPATAAVDGGAPSGMNALWVDALGRVRAQHTGATALPAVGAVRAAAASRASATSWDVSWVETRGTGEVLLYDVLDCK